MARAPMKPRMPPAVAKTKATQSPAMGEKTSPRIKNYTLPKRGGGRKK